MLVLSVVSKFVCLERKEVGNRMQLWCMTPQGLLIHEGSSPPKEPSKTHTLSRKHDWVS